MVLHLRRHLPSLAFWSTPRSPSPPPLIDGGRGSPGRIDDDSVVIITAVEFVAVAAAVAEVEFDDGDDDDGMMLNRRILLSRYHVHTTILIYVIYDDIKTSTNKSSTK